MKNKKGYSSLDFPLFICVLVIAIVLGLMIYEVIKTNIGFPKEAEDRCNKLSMEVLDYEKPSGQKVGSITCYNPTTKETRIIR